MNGLFLKLAITAAAFNLLSAAPAAAQHPPPKAGPPIELPPPAKKPARVEIKLGPALEMARDDLAIIRWTTNNPGGTDVHFAVAYYGTDPEDLSQMAKSQIRINRGHSETIFRVRMDRLKPQTTYYYKVTSTESNGKSDGVESAVSQFTTPGPGERIVAFPSQPALPPR
jgi:phosphodiesterase/alkaline phosphatase D-like protein